MSYIINHYEGQQLAQVSDATIDDSTCDIKLIGRNYAGYGEAQNENFVFLLENFARGMPPNNPITGQIWYDTTTNKLKFYDGNMFMPTARMEVCNITPTYAPKILGDLWFNTANNQLFAWDGSKFLLVGPEGGVGGTTRMRVSTVLDTSDVEHVILEAVVNDEVISIISSDEFTLSNKTPRDGFNLIHNGITLVNTENSGITSSSHRFWGTASNAENAETLNGRTEDDFHPKYGSTSLSLSASYLTIASNTAVNLNGTIRYSNGTFQGYHNGSWITFGGVETPVSVSNGGTGVSGFGTGGILVGSSNTISTITPGAPNTFLMRSGSSGYSWEPITPGSGGEMIWPTSNGIVLYDGNRTWSTRTLVSGTNLYLKLDNGNLSWSTITSSGTQIEQRYGLGTNPYPVLFTDNTGSFIGYDGYSSEPATISSSATISSVLSATNANNPYYGYNLHYLTISNLTSTSGLIANTSTISALYNGAFLGNMKYNLVVTVSSSIINIVIPGSSTAPTAGSTITEIKNTTNWRPVSVIPEQIAQLKADKIIPYPNGTAYIGTTDRPFSTVRTKVIEPVVKFFGTGKSSDNSHRPPLSDCLAVEIKGYYHGDYTLNGGVGIRINNTAYSPDIEDFLDGSQDQYDPSQGYKGTVGYFVAGEVGCALTSEKQLNFVSGDLVTWYVGTGTDTILELSSNGFYPSANLLPLDLGGPKASGSNKFPWANLYLNLNAGTVTIDNTGKISNSTSDIKFKHNIQPIVYGLKEVLQLNPVSFEWTEESRRGPGTQIGFIAQEVEKIVPELVHYGGNETDSYKSLEYGNITSLLTKAIQEQQVIIENLRSSFTVMKTEYDSIIAELRQEINELKS